MTPDKIIQTAAAEIGVTESPANSNLQKYGQAYGYNGVPWCVIFVWWVFNQSGAPELFFWRRENRQLQSVYILG